MKFLTTFSAMLLALKVAGLTDISYILIALPVAVQVGMDTYMHYKAMADLKRQQDELLELLAREADRDVNSYLDEMERERKDD